MPIRKARPIPLEVLLTNRMQQELSPTYPLNDIEVAAITALSRDQLKDRRKAKKPPLPRKVEKKGEAIWYPWREVEAYLKSLLPEPAASGIHSFAQFLGQAAKDDTWLFRRNPEGRLVDFFESLPRRRRAVHPIDGEPVLVLTLDEYLDDVGNWIAKQRTKKSNRDLKIDVPPPPDIAACPKCGKADLPGHRCRRL